jgi:CheY-like chemotaxis protein
MIAKFVSNKCNEPSVSKRRARSIVLYEACRTKVRTRYTFDRFFFRRRIANTSAMKNSHASVGKLVVVIDDDALVLDATGGLLRSWGFQVVAAQGFEEALQLLAKVRRRPDLIVCDYRLSKGATGVDAIEALRCAFEIPALVISGDWNCPRGNLNRNGYQLLHKPLSADTFRAALIDACVLQL